MRKSAGERAILKEQRRLEKERQRQIALANKMLIPTGKKTLESLELESFDPSGVFHFLGGCWKKVYSFSGNTRKLPVVCKNLHGRIRVTFGMSKGDSKDTCYLTLTESGEIYEEVRNKMMEDEAKINEVSTLHPMTVDETMSLIGANFLQDIRFSYASEVRGKKDWKKECFGSLEEEMSSFKMKGLYGESFYCLSFPKSKKEGLIKQLKELDCPMYIAVDMNALSVEDQSDFNRALERRYHTRILSTEEESYLNTSMEMVILCDSDDAREIVEQTVLAIMTSYGVVSTVGYHFQRELAESILSLGLIDVTSMRNTNEEVVRMLIGGDPSADAKVEV